MKYLVLALGFFFSFIGYTQERSFSDLALSDTLITVDGNEISFESIIEQNKGSVVLIDIWASWCKDCIVGMPTIKKLRKKYSDVSFVFISLNTA